MRHVRYCTRTSACKLVPGKVLSGHVVFRSITTLLHYKTTKNPAGVGNTGSNRTRRKTENTNHQELQFFQSAISEHECLDPRFIYVDSYSCFNHGCCCFWCCNRVMPLATCRHHVKATTRGCELRVKITGLLRTNSTAYYIAWSWKPPFASNPALTCWSTNVKKTKASWQFSDDVIICVFNSAECCTNQYGHLSSSSYGDSHYWNT